MKQQNKYLKILILCFIYNSQHGFAQLSLEDSCSFFNEKPIFPYYYPSSPNNGKDFYTQKKEFKKTIITQTTFDGIITIIFFINEKGETNFYQTQLCDLNYKPIIVSKDLEKLCNETLQAVKNASPWKPMLDEQKRAINCRKFYSFKFNKGKLIEILPK